MGMGSSVRIPPGHGNLDIEFTALSFSQPERVRFRYRLEAWTATGRPGLVVRPLIIMCRLGLRFPCHAATYDGVWNETGALASVGLRRIFIRRPFL